jgi:hypothetical protein
MTERYGLDIALDYYFRTPAEVATFLTESGLSLYAQARVEPQGQQRWGRAFALAQKPTGSA